MKRANLMVRFIFVENAVFIISDQSSCCQLVDHLCLSSKGEKMIQMASH